MPARVQDPPPEPRETDVDARASTTAQGSARYAGFAGVLCLALLWIRFSAGYPLFHAATELVAVVVAFSIFTVAWNTRAVAPNRYLEVMGIAFLYAGVADSLHLLAFGSTIGLPIAATELATPLWLAGRVTLAAGVLIAPFAVGREAKAWPLPLIWAVGAVALFLAAVGSLAPAALRTAAGVQRFVVPGGLAAVTCFLLGWLLLSRERDAFDADVYRLLAAFLLCSVAAEALLTATTNTRSAALVAGHLLRVVAYLLIYRAVAVATLNRPYDTLFRELNRTTEALEVSEDLLSATVTQASVGIIRLAADGSILMANPRAAEIAGRERDGLVGRSIANLTRVNDPEKLMNSVSRLATGEITSFRIEAEVIRPDERETIASLALSSVINESGEPLYFIGVIEDVTERRAAERILKRSRDLNVALTAIDLAVNSTSDVDEIVQRATEATWRALGSDAVVTLTREETTWLVRSAFGMEDDLVGRSFGLDALQQASDAVDSGVPIAIGDIRDTAHVNAALVERYDLRATMAIPLTFREGILGVIYAIYRDGPHTFTEPELDFARKLASSLSLAIENARLYTSEQIVADTLQSALLVAPTSLPGLSVGAAYESATDLSRVGGDFYDVFPLGDTRVAFVVGDVAGKGLEAATFTAAARTTIRAFALQTGSPSEALAAANAALAAQLEEERFVTCVLGVIDVADGALRLASAGHPEPVLCDVDGCGFRDIDRSPPLGVLADGEFSEHRTSLGPGDRVVAFSDGLLDARYGTALFGEDGVLAVLHSVGEDPAANVARTLLDAARGFSGGVLKDDIAVVVLDYEGPPATSIPT